MCAMNKQNGGYGAGLDLSYVAGYEAGYNVGRNVGYMDGYDVGYNVGFKAGHKSGVEYARRYPLWKTIFDSALAVTFAVVVFAALITWASAAPPKPDEKPVTKPAIAIDLSCQPLDVPPADAASAGAEDALDWAEWATATADNDKEFSKLVARRMVRLGYFVGVADAASLGEARRAYLAAYVLAVKSLYDGDVPDYAVKAFKTGIARAKAKVAATGYKCVDV